MEVAQNQLSTRTSRDPAAGSAPYETAAVGGPGLIERILLTTDGTVTILLEQIVGEGITTSALAHRSAPVDPLAAAALPHPPGSLTTRTTQLIGTETGTVYVRATSLFCPQALPERIHTSLMTTGEPLGRLLRRNRIESFREILSIDLPDGHGRQEPRRRYVICIGGSPAVHIEEIFSAQCFRSRTAAAVAAD
ncbi:chorismate--pyruvate lyase family protein [Streptomyces sediminimaris]|uniref:chorismate--pyruvate lyase family protein n=1 Tax=Streptomyces sediminimaris TaxID=3383721 RepID=UPI00399B1410